MPRLCVGCFYLQGGESPSRLQLVDYPFPDFHPHGLDVFVDDDGGITLYVINHQPLELYTFSNFTQSPLPDERAQRG